MPGHLYTGGLIVGEIRYQILDLWSKNVKRSSSLTLKVIKNIRTLPWIIWQDVKVDPKNMSEIKISISKV